MLRTILNIALCFAIYFLMVYVVVESIIDKFKK